MVTRFNCSAVNFISSFVLCVHIVATIVFNVRDFSVVAQESREEIALLNLHRLLGILKLNLNCFEKCFHLKNNINLFKN